MTYLLRPPLLCPAFLVNHPDSRRRQKEPHFLEFHSKVPHSQTVPEAKSGQAPKRPPWKNSLCTVPRQSLPLQKLRQNVQAIFGTCKFPQVSILTSLRCRKTLHMNPLDIRHSWKNKGTYHPARLHYTLDAIPGHFPQAGLQFRILPELKRCTLRQDGTS